MIRSVGVSSKCCVIMTYLCRHVLVPRLLNPYWMGDLHATWYLYGRSDIHWMTCYVLCYWSLLIENFWTLSGLLLYTYETSRTIVIFNGLSGLNFWVLELIEPNIHVYWAPIKWLVFWLVWPTILYVGHPSFSFSMWDSSLSFLLNFISNRNTLWICLDMATSPLLYFLLLSFLSATLWNIWTVSSFFQLLRLLFSC